MLCIILNNVVTDINPMKAATMLQTTVVYNVTEIFK